MTREERERNLEEGRLDELTEQWKTTPRAEKERRLNELVMRWKTTPSEGNEALRQALWTELFVLFFELYDKKGPLKESQEVLNVFETTVKHYDPDRGFPYTHYVNRMMKYRWKDKTIPDTITIHTAEGKAEIPVSYTDMEQADRPIIHEGGKTTVRLSMNPAEMETAVLLESLYDDLTALILNFARRHQGKNASPQRLLWYRLFYTEDMTLSWKERQFRCLHERDVFQALYQPYLDYYMSRPCHSGDEVAATPLKRYGEVVPDCKETERGQETKVPLPADVSLNYLRRVEGISRGVSKTNRANLLNGYNDSKTGKHITGYREEVRDILKN